MIKICDSQGVTLGYVDSAGAERRVLDNNYRTLGWLTSRGTFDAQRRHLSTQQVPGLLLNR